MSQRKAKAPLIRGEEAEARRIAACIETPQDLLDALAYLSDDYERVRAIELLKPYLKFSVTSNF